MESITSVNLHRFSESILAEVVEETIDGEISIRSHELEFVDSKESTVRPLTTIPSMDAMLINQYASGNGITVQFDKTVQPKPLE